MTRTRTFAALVAALSLLALPVIAQANDGQSHGKSQGKGKAHTMTDKGKAKRCAKAQKVGYNVSGTLVSYTADDALTTDVNEGSVTLTVTGSNSHAEKAGIADSDLATVGTQYTVNAADPHETVLDGFEGDDKPSVGDEVHVNGKITRSKKKCPPAGGTAGDRYGDADVRKVTISDRDADTAPVVPAR